MQIEFEHRRDGQVERYLLPRALVADPGTFDGYRQELAKLILTQIETYPETHGQKYWVGYGDFDCDTTLCVAGWAQLFTYGYLISSAGIDVGKDARRLLGLSKEDARILFYYATDSQVVEAMRMLANGFPIDWKTVAPTLASSPKPAALLEML